MEIWNKFSYNNYDRPVQAWNVVVIGRVALLDLSFPLLPTLRYKTLVFFS